MLLAIRDRGGRRASLVRVNDPTFGVEENPSELKNMYTFFLLEAAFNHLVTFEWLAISFTVRHLDISALHKKLSSL